MKRPALIALPALIAGLSGCGDEVDYVAGDLVVFNDNGAWSWYQDERAIIDRERGALLIGSVAVTEGADGARRGGDIDVVSYDLESGALARFRLADLPFEDDHNAPALLLRPDGRYLAVYTSHNADRLTRYRVSVAPHDASRWEDERVFDWRTVKSNFNVTYSNVFHLSAEQRVYDFARADNRSPNFLISDDEGSTFRYGGALTQSKNLGYVNGYFKYASNGVDRVHFLGTEHHPRDFNTSVYHGVFAAGRVHTSTGALLDEDLADNDAIAPSELTPVIRAGSRIGGEAHTHLWLCDLQLDREGHPRAILTARANDDPEGSNFSDHRLLYARFDGASWRVHPLARAGGGLFDAERDYTGLGAIDPSDPSTVYLSTPLDPTTGQRTTKREIYKGVTRDGGESWSFTAVTHASTRDNIRPIVPAWDEHHTALLWLRGTMRLSQRYRMEVVGIVERR